MVPLGAAGGGQVRILGVLGGFWAVWCVLGRSGACGGGGLPVLGVVGGHSIRFKRMRAARMTLEALRLAGSRGACLRGVGTRRVRGCAR